MQAVINPPKTTKQFIRVMLIDDDMSILDMMQIVLRTKKVLCHPQLYGSTNLIEEFDPHVLLIDYQLKDGTAFDILKSYNFSSRKNIPIIFTGLEIPDPVKSQLYMLGVMNIITKPSTISTIESVIENYYEISLKYRN